MRRMLDMRSYSLLVIGFALVLSGCAGSPPKPHFVQPPKKEAIIHSTDTANVSVAAATGVEMLDNEKSRLSNVISQKINEKKIKSIGSGAASAFDVEVSVTRYEKGNAFARAMLAGLGQIHIDAKVRLLTAGTQDQLSSFDIKKTFAWGGLYGGTTRIDDVEPAFAEGIAAALTGLPEDSKQPASATK